MTSVGRIGGLAFLTILVGASASACGEEDEYSFSTGALMKPGEDCIYCHGSPISPYAEAPGWSAAGTVYDGPQGTQGVHDVTVRIRDATGKTVEVQTNHAGNFYTGEALAPPFQVELEKDGTIVEMPVPAPTGACNACHTNPPGGGAPGRLFVPTSRG